MCTQEAFGAEIAFVFLLMFHFTAGSGIHVRNRLCQLCRRYFLSVCEPDHSCGWRPDCGSDCKPDRSENLCEGSEGDGFPASDFLVHLYRIRSSEG